jgi:hypothetical protein
MCFWHKEALLLLPLLRCLLLLLLLLLLLPGLAGLMAPAAVTAVGWLSLLAVAEAMRVMRPLNGQNLLVVMAAAAITRMLLPCGSCSAQWCRCPAALLLCVPLLATFLLLLPAEGPLLAAPPEALWLMVPGQWPAVPAWTPSYDIITRWSASAPAVPAHGAAASLVEGLAAASTGAAHAVPLCGVPPLVMAAGAAASPAAAKMTWIIVV